MTGLLLALAGAYGVFLIFTSVAFGWTGLAPRPGSDGAGYLRSRARSWVVQVGLDEMRPAELVAAFGLLFVVGALVAWALFGGVLPPLVAGLAAASAPLAAARSRRERRRLEAREAWPHLIEELRIKTTTLGRSIPQALLEVGRRAPDDLRPAFDAARREWLISTDFEATLDVLKSRLADATADTVCETLLVAHAIGGTEIDRCLTALVDDRILDQQSRKDAHARHAGARFARRFVLVVPLGMALIGLSIGEGRRAYQSATAQLLVLVALALMGLCWVWAGHMMRLPVEERVFGATGGSGERR